MEKIKTGILGYGAAARMHMTSLAMCPEREVTGIYGPNPEKCKKFAEEYGITPFESREALFDANDCIHIATPNGNHYEDIMDCLAHRKHTVCEKPVCMTDEECDAVEKAVEKSDVKFTAVSQFRFSKVYGIVKNAIDRGDFGKLLTANVRMMYYRSPEYYNAVPWRGSRTRDGGVLMTQSLHGIDVTLGLLGKPVAVTAMAKTMHHDIEAADTSAALVEMENGMAVLFETSTASFPGYPRQYSISGTAGTVEMIEESIARWDIPGKENLELPVSVQDLASGASDPNNLDYSLHATQYREFSNAILHNAPLSYTLYDATQTVRLINGIFRSQEENRKIFL